MAVTPDHWRDFVTPFDPPPENLTIEFPNITVLDQSSCSACQSTLLLFLNRYRERIFDYFPSQTPIQVAIGKGHTDVPEGTLLIGNCTLHHRDKGIFVPGCPPVGSQIFAAISGKACLRGHAVRREAGLVYTVGRPFQADRDGLAKAVLRAV